MVNTLRYVIFWALYAVILAVFLFYYRKKQSARAVILCIASLACVAVLFSTHIENLVLRYESPQSAYENSGQDGTVFYTVDSENSTLLFALEEDTVSMMLLQKSGEKWRIPMTQDKYSAAGTIGAITAVGEKNSNNYYFVLSLFDVPAYAMLDNRGTSFDSYASNDVTYSSIEDTYSYEVGYVAFVEDVDADYRLIINDNEVDIVAILNLPLV